MTLDVEVVAEVEGRGRFDRALAVLIGTAAVLAALLGAVQLDVSKQEERSLLRSSRLAVRVFELTAATGAVSAFGGVMLREASGTSAGGIARRLVAFDQPDVADVQNALAAAEEAAAERLTGLIGPMAAPSPLPSALDPHAAGLVSIGAGDVQTVLTLLADPSASVEFHVAAEGMRQTNALNAEVDRAERLGGRGASSLLGLALLALGGVLLGLASVLPRGPGGDVALATAAGAIALAAALAVASVA